MSKPEIINAISVLSSIAGSEVFTAETRKTAETKMLSLIALL